MASWSGEAFAANCTTYEPVNPIDCNSGDAYFCYDGQPEESSECFAGGFAYGGTDGPWSCHAGISGCSAGNFAAVPEMSDYAAAAFITLALLIGWRVRQRYRPVN